MESLEFLMNFWLLLWFPCLQNLLWLLCWPGFLNLSASAILGWILLCWGRKCIGGCLAASPLVLPSRRQSTFFSLSVVTPRHVSRGCHMSFRGQNPHRGELGLTMRNGLGYHSTGVWEDATSEGQAKPSQKNTNNIQKNKIKGYYFLSTSCVPSTVMDYS